MDLVQHHEPGTLRAEIAARSGQPFLIGRVLQIEIQARHARPLPARSAARLHDGPGQGGLPDLSRPQEGYGREEPQVIFYARTQEPRDYAFFYPCNHGIKIRNCKDFIISDHPADAKAADEIRRIVKARFS